MKKSNTSCSRFLFKTLFLCLFLSTLEPINAQQNPCPDHQSLQFSSTPVPGNPNLCNWTVIVEFVADDKKCIRYSISGSHNQNFDFPNSAALATYTETITFQAPCSPAPTISYAGYTASNGQCQGQACATSSLGVLPVKLINFNGEVTSSSTVKLDWKTASEIDNSHFRILKSYDGQEFEIIAKISSTSTNGNGASYEYEDLSRIEKGASYAYYKLQQVDQDQKTTNSSIIAVKLNGPNLALSTSDGQLRIFQGDSNIEKESFFIYNSNGQIALTGEVQSSSIDISSLSKGIYILRLQNNLTSHTFSVF